MEKVILLAKQIELTELKNKIQERINELEVEIKQWEEQENDREN